MKKSTQEKNKILIFISNGLGEVEFIYHMSLINTDNLDIRFLYLEKNFQKASSDLLWSSLIK